MWQSELERGAIVKELQRKPEVIVFAGPNGSGKSTFTELLRPTDIDYINADEIKKNLKCSSMEAAKLAEKQREEHLSNMFQIFVIFMIIQRQNHSEFLKKEKQSIFMMSVLTG